jgi:glyoxylate reductase
MKVIYNDINQVPALQNELKAEYKATTEEVLREADVVSVHVPLMPSTQHLINADRLKMMKSSAYLINTSRGPVVDEAALVTALKEGIIRGAGLDVFENEPSLASGLAALPNVVITPHIASATEETRDKMSQMVAEEVLDFLNGTEPKNVVKE